MAAIAGGHSEHQLLRLASSEGRGAHSRPEGCLTPSCAACRTCESAARLVAMACALLTSAVASGDTFPGARHSVLTF